MLTLTLVCIDVRLVGCASAKRVKFCPSVPGDAPAISGDDYDRHVAELGREWRKQKRSVEHINVLLRDTHVNRRAWISQLPAGEFSKIMDLFPCFEDGQFVSNILHVILCVM